MSFTMNANSFTVPPARLWRAGWVSAIGQRREDDTCAFVLLPTGETIVLDPDALASERASVVKYGCSEIFKDVLICAFKRAASLKCV